MSENYISKAFNVLHSIVFDKAYSNIELSKALKDCDERDKAKITKIVYGVLDNYVYLNFILENLCKEKPKKIVELVSCVGIYLLRFMNSVPTYTAVNETVNLLKNIKKESQCGFVNAILRKSINYEVNYDELDEVKRLSIEYSYPTWIINKYLHHFPEDIIVRILKKNEENFYVIRNNAFKIDEKSFIDLLNRENIEFEILSKNLFKVSDLKLLNKKYKDLFLEQSYASIKCVDNMEIRDNSLILDACASPGGKSVYMAEKNKNGQIYANDIHAHRVDLINNYASFVGCKNVLPMQSDITDFKEDFVEKFDFILLDVPCSGLGMVNKRPDIKLNREEKDINEIRKIQKQILKVTAAYLKKGGVLMYSTCTLLREENENVIREFMQGNDEFVIEKLNLDFDTEYGSYILPSDFNQDGFYMCKMIKS